MNKSDPYEIDLAQIKLRDLKCTEIIPDEQFIAIHRNRGIQYFGCEKLQPFNKDWWVSPKGDMVNICGYPIFDYQLREDDWFLHLMEKPWFNANTFLPAYFEACHKANIKEIKIRTQYE